jgi:hypothetical protein
MSCTDLSEGLPKPNLILIYKSYSPEAEEHLHSYNVL